MLSAVIMMATMMMIKKPKAAWFFRNLLDMKLQCFNEVLRMLNLPDLEHWHGFAFELLHCPQDECTI